MWFMCTSVSTVEIMHANMTKGTAACTEGRRASCATNTSPTKVSNTHSCGGMSQEVCIVAKQKRLKYSAKYLTRLFSITTGENEVAYAPPVP